MDVKILATAGDVADAAADLITTAIGAGTTTIGLCGGSTPRPTYELLPRREIDWSSVTLWIGDERWVPVDHPDSNAGMAKAAFADEVGARVLIPRHDVDHPAESASAYETALFQAFGERGTPQLVLLGIGDDGHTASLFPGTHALELERAGYVANWVPEKEAWRLTATMPLLWSAEHLVFIVTGEAKASVLARIIDRGRNYPAQRVAAGASRVTWLVDAPAASELAPRS